MPILDDPREIVTSVAFACGYRSDVGCTTAQWSNYIDPATFPLLQSNASFRPAATVESEIHQPALQFTGDTLQTEATGGPSFPTTKSRYIRAIVRLDAYGGADRDLFSAGTSGRIKTGSFPGELKMTTAGVNAIDVPFSTFRRLDAVFSVAASDTWLRFGSIITRGGAAVPANNVPPNFGGFAMCGFSNQVPDITVAAAWVLRGRPTDRELANWDASDAARYGAGVLA